MMTDFEGGKEKRRQYDWEERNDSLFNNGQTEMAKDFTDSTVGSKWSATSIRGVVVKKLVEKFLEARAEHERQKQYEEQTKETMSTSNSFVNGMMKIGMLFGGILFLIGPILLPVFLAVTLLVSGVGTILSMPQGELPIVQVARQELEDWEQNIGGEKYKTWYKYDGNWCAMFVSYCANECGYLDGKVMDKFMSVYWMSEWYKERGLWQDTGKYKPKAGDIIFFQNDSSHVGIVVEFDSETNTIYTIEGNTGSSRTIPYHKGSRVKMQKYTLKYYKISGYGTPEYPELEMRFEWMETGDVKKRKEWEYVCV